MLPIARKKCESAANCFTQILKETINFCRFLISQGTL